MKRRSVRIFLSLLAAVGFVAGAAVAPPAQAAQALGDFYNSTSIHRVNLTIEQTSINNLGTKPKEYTAARVEFVTGGNRSSGLIDIGLRLKGSTSLDKLTGKPSLKIKFNWKDLKGNRFLGLKGMTLNAMTQDSSMIHEASAYRFMNLIGLPTSKTGYAEVFINGVSKGLYLNVETPDDVFLSKRFTNPTQHLYEAQAFRDLLFGNDGGTDIKGAYLVDEGWKTTPNKKDLTKLIQVANLNDNAQWWSKLNTYTDRTLLIRTFAAENLLGHWDSYSGPIINNHFWRSDDKGKFTMIPWGVDQTFGENRATTTILLDDYFFAMDARDVGYPWVKIANKKDTLPRGLLFQRCLDYKPCKTAYLTELKSISAKATSYKMPTIMSSYAKLIKGYSSAGAIDEQKRSIAWLAKQQTTVAKLMKKYGIK